MKQRKLLLRLALTVFFIFLTVYHLYPTYRYSELRKVQEREILSLAQLTSAPAAELERAVQEGRNQDVMDYISAGELSAENQALAKQKVDDLLGSFAEKLDKSHRQSLKLGLDLQGGMHLVLEVNLVELMKQLANNPDPLFDSLMADISQRLRDPTLDFNQTVTEVFASAHTRLSRYFLESQASDRQVLDYLSKEADDAIARSLEIMRELEGQGKLSATQASWIQTIEQRLAALPPGGEK